MRDDLYIRFLPFPNRAVRAAVITESSVNWDSAVNRGKSLVFPPRSNS